LLAASGLALAGPLAVPSQALAAAPEAGLVLVQGFGNGSLFPTQGDAGVPPYTVILWDAADRGIFYAARDGAAGFAPTDALIAAMEAGEQPRAAVVAPATDDAGGQQVWALRLVYAGAGSDPGAVTYQGEPIEEAEAAAWLGVAPLTLPEGAQELAGGYLLIAGLPALDLPEETGVRLNR
jgi:hypothetical protein